MRFSPGALLPDSAHCYSAMCRVYQGTRDLEGLQVSALCMYSRSTAMLGNVTLPRPRNRLQHGVVCLANSGAHKNTGRRHCIGGWSFLEMALTSLRSAALHDGTDQGRRSKHQRDPGHRNLSSLNPQAPMINASPGPCHPRRHRHPTFENVISHVIKLPSDWPIACSANWVADAPAKSYENFQLQTSPSRNPPALSHSHPQNRKSRHNGLPSHSPLSLHHRPPPSGCPEGRAQEGDQAQPRDSGAS